MQRFADQLARLVVQACGGQVTRALQVNFPGRSIALYIPTALLPVPVHPWPLSGAKQERVQSVAEIFISHKWQCRSLPIPSLDLPIFSLRCL